MEIEYESACQADSCCGLTDTAWSSTLIGARQWALEHLSGRATDAIEEGQILRAPPCRGPVLISPTEELIQFSRHSLPRTLRFRILHRDSFACRYCGARAPDVTLHVDHVVAVCRGGTDDEDNLVAACEACNLGKRDMVLNREE